MARNVLCFGDSLTEGLCNKYTWEMRPYTTVFQNLLGPDYVVDNAGVSGATTNQMLESLDMALQSKTYQYIFILGGTNDISLRKADMISDTLIQLLQKSLKHSAVTFSLSIPQMMFGSSLYKEGKRNEINSRLEEFAKQTENCHFIDWAQHIPNNYAFGADCPMWSDNIHLSAAGYQKMGEVIYSFSKEYFE